MSVSHLGPLGTLLTQSGVTDVVVNAGHVWIDRGSGMERVDIHIGDEKALRRLAQQMASTCGRRLDDAQPWVDARLPDGTRFHAILPPLAPAGVCLSLRAFRPRVFSIEELIHAGTLTTTSATLVQAIVTARLSYVVTGGTGSGKTTLLSALLSCISPRERIVIAEDVTEISTAHPHVVSLQTRVANAEGAGEVTLRHLVRQALRMRPDRLVVGECRGAEVIELLSALNTGHNGSTGTLHANSPVDVPARIEALTALGGMSVAATQSQLAAGLHCVLHLSRTAAGRVLSDIGVVRPIRNRVHVEPAWQINNPHTPGPAWPFLRECLQKHGEVVEAPW